MLVYLARSCLSVLCAYICEYWTAGDVFPFESRGTVSMEMIVEGVRVMDEDGLNRQYGNIEIVIPSIGTLTLFYEWMELGLLMQGTY